jgi:hypothetical protein
MEGVVTILGEPFYEMVKTIWREVDRACSMHSFKPTDIPFHMWLETYQRVSWCQS